MWGPFQIEIYLGKGRDGVALLDGGNCGMRKWSGVAGPGFEEAVSCYDSVYPVRPS